MRTKYFFVLAICLMINLNNVFAITDNKQKDTLYDTISENAELDNIQSEYVLGANGIDFSETASEYNGKGIYTIADTQNEKYPIYYYRGSEVNNNVLFANQCWRIVRTTETGGVKLVYDGKPGINNTCGDNRFYNKYWSEYVKYYDSNLSITEIDSSYMYGNFIKYDYFSGDEEDWYKFLNIKTNVRDNFDYSNYYYSSKVTYKNGKYILDDPVKFENLSYIEHKYTCWSENTDGCSTLYYIEDAWTGYDNESTYATEMTFENGETVEKLLKKEIPFGSDVTYENGKYSLKNIVYITYEDLITNGCADEIDSHPYTFFVSTDTSKINYIDEYQHSDYYSDYFSLEYFVFDDGALTPKEAFNRYNSDNKIESLTKKTVDTWFKNNVSNYINIMEDTIWCNDRQTDNNSTFNRFHRSTPTLNCYNSNDRFTVSVDKGNGKLIYPTGILTIDELMYAGIAYDEYSDSYFPRFNFVTMSPAINSEKEQFPYLGNQESAYDYDAGCAESTTVECSQPYVLPTISLKHDVTRVAGDGTSENPYQIGLVYKVTYKYEGTVPKDAPEVPLDEYYIAGEEIKVSNNPTLNNYIFSGWTTKDAKIENGNFIMPEKDVVIVGRWSKVPNTIDNVSKYMVLLVISSLMLLFMLKHRLVSNSR